MSDNSMAAGAVGAVAVGGASWALTTRAANTGLGKATATVIGARIGGNVTEIPKFISQVLVTKHAQEGKLGNFAAKHSGGTAHLTGKLASAASDTSIAHAGEALASLAERPGVPEPVANAIRTAGADGTADLINAGKKEVISAVVADAAGNTAHKASGKVLPIIAGVVGALIGFSLLSNAVQ